MNNAKLDPMSDEQRVIYEHIRDGKNVVVDACAGSGKSTTILSIATNMPCHRFIQLTYNSMLCAEIKTKADALGLANIEIYTYHSLAVRYYANVGYTDTMIRRVLSMATPPKVEIPKFHVLVIDETQDMTMLYFRLVSKFCIDHGHPIQLLILGDFMQGLYEFKGADTRFLTNAVEIWSDFRMLSTQAFEKCSLKMSYRITREMADFVNDVMLGERRLFACKNGPQVVYLRRSMYDAEKYVVYHVTRLLQEGVSPADIFVLGSSVKGARSAIRKMENALVEKHVPCHVPMMETADKIDERVIQGKVVFSTFHSVKGRQRKYVFVMGFDQSYFKFFARNLPQDKCPNTLYVACTRATHGLVVIENHNKREDRPLLFLRQSHAEMQKHPSIDFKGLPQSVFYEDTDMNGTGDARRDGKLTHYVTPTELNKFIPETTIERILPLVERIFVKVSDEESENMIEIPTVIKTKKGFHEDVSDLNGIAIPLMYFDAFSTFTKDSATSESSANHHDTNTSDIPEDDTCDRTINGSDMLYRLIQDDMDHLNPNEHSFLRKLVSRLPQRCVRTQDYLQVANAFVAVREKLYFKVNQIADDEYNWISENIKNECFERIHRTLYAECVRPDPTETDWDGRAIEIEKTIVSVGDEPLHRRVDHCLAEYFPNELFRFTARVDAVTRKNVWEIKCVSELTNDHFLQVVIYAWLWRMCVEDMSHLRNIRDFRIFNIRSGEIYRLEAETNELTQIMVELLRGKYGEPENTDNHEFIEQCKSWHAEYCV